MKIDEVGYWQLGSVLKILKVSRNGRHVALVRGKKIGRMWGTWEDMDQKEVDE